MIDQQCDLDFRKRVGGHLAEVVKDAFAYGATSAIARLSGLLVLPLLTRVLSVSEFGTVEIALVFVALLSTTMKLGLPMAIPRFFSERSEDSSRPEMISSMLWFLTGVAVVSMAATSLLARPLSRVLFQSADHAVVLRLGCAIVVLNVVMCIPEVVLRCERRLLQFNLVNLSFAAIYIVLLVFYLTEKRAGVRGVLLSQIWASAIVLFLELIFIRRYLRIGWSVSVLKKTLRYGLPMLPGTLASRVNAQVDRILLLSLAGLGGVAFFGAGSIIVRIGGFFLEIFRRAWQPYAMRLIDAPERNEVYRRVLNYYAGIFAVMALALTAISPELLSVLTPPEYHRAYLVVPWLIGAAILQQAAVVTNLGILISGRTGRSSMVTWVGAAINLPLGWLLIRTVGFSGAGIASFVSELLVTALLLRSSEKASNIRFDLGSVGKILVCYCLGSLAILLGTATSDGFRSLMLRGVVFFVCLTVIAFYASRSRTVSPLAAAS